MSEPAKVPFKNWVPAPRWIFVDRRADELTSAEAWVLLCLYEAADQRTWTAVFAGLDAIRHRCAWEHSIDYLSKVLRSLREKGLIAFDTTPGNTCQRYAIRLLYDRAELSEHSPSRNACAEGDFGPSHAQPSPSRRRVSPSSQEPAKPAPERDSGAADASSVRAVQDVSREALLEERVGIGEGARAVGATETNQGAPQTGDDVDAETDSNDAEQAELIASTDRLLELVRGTEAPALFETHPGAYDPEHA